MKLSALARRILADLSVMFGAILLCFLSMEIGLRVIYGNPHIFHSPQVRYVKTDYGYKPEPNQHSYVLDKPAVTNSAGFRDSKEWIRPKPEGTYRILMVGGSFAFGAGVNAEERFSALLEDRLRHRRKNVEVLNVSAQGWNLRHQIAFFEAEGLDYDPDAVIFVHCLVDFVSPPRPGVPGGTPPVNLSPEGRWDSRPSWLKWLSYDRIYKIKLSATVMYLRDKMAVIGAKPGFGVKLLQDQIDLDAEPTIAYTYSQYGEVKTALEAEGIPMVIATIPMVNFFWLSDGEPSYVSHFKRFAETEGIEFVDLSRNLVTPRDRNLYYLYPWDGHLNPTGQERIAEQLFPIVDRLIPPQ